MKTITLREEDWARMREALLSGLRFAKQPYYDFINKALEIQPVPETPCKYCIGNTPDTCEIHGLEAEKPAPESGEAQVAEAYKELLTSLDFGGNIIIKDHSVEASNKMFAVFCKVTRMLAAHAQKPESGENREIAMKIAEEAAYFAGYEPEARMRGSFVGYVYHLIFTALTAKDALRTDVCEICCTSSWVPMPSGGFSCQMCRANELLRGRPDVNAELLAIALPWIERCPSDGLDAQKEMIIKRINEALAASRSKGEK